MEHGPSTLDHKPRCHERSHLTLCGIVSALSWYAAYLCVFRPDVELQLNGFSVADSFKNITKLHGGAAWLQEPVAAQPASPSTSEETGNRQQTPKKTGNRQRLAPAAWWPKGSWSKQAAGTRGSLSSYRLGKCVNSLPGLDVLHRYLEEKNKKYDRPMGGWTFAGDGLPGEKKKHRTYELPTLKELQNNLQGRTFVFWGDSLAFQEFASFVLMLLCHTDGATPYCSHEASQVAFPTLGAKVYFCKKSFTRARDQKASTQ